MKIHQYKNLIEVNNKRAKNKRNIEFKRTLININLLELLKVESKKIISILIKNLLKIKPKP